MTLELNRTNFAPDGIFGTLGKDNIVYWHTLEHSYHCSPKLPDGTYTCVRGHHQLHSGPIETFEITGVPGHSGILFHYGNVNSDSAGCVLLGMGETAASVTESREAFDGFVDLVKGLDTFTLAVTSS